MIRRYIPKSTQELADWYMRYVSPLALIAGFFLDNLILLRRVDMWRSNALLFFYLSVALACIVLIHLIENGKLRHRIYMSALPIIPVVAQFAFGGLFSGYLSLYSRSANYAVSWVFVALIAVLLVGNERFVRLYKKFTFQISVYFTVLFSFLIFFLPVIFHKIGPFMFLLSGALSVLLITLFLMLFSRVFPEIVRRDQTAIARSVAAIFVVFNVLYFSNAIPPLPLALKDAGVYHSIARTSGSYTLTFEPVPWYESYLRFNTLFHRAPGEPVVVWSAIFAPSGLSTTVFHQWQRYDDERGGWVTTSTLSYPINGGRDGGYRGYTMRYDIEAGKWRVNVITPHGQIIGRVSFEVVDVASPVHLESTTQ